MNDCVAKRPTQEILCFFMKFFVPQLDQFRCIFCHIRIIVALFLLLIYRLIVQIVLLFKDLERWLCLCVLYLAISLSKH